MLQAVVLGIQATGERSFGRGAQIGDKTLMDALIPCAQCWTENAGKGLSAQVMFRLGAQAAAAGAKYTETIVARMGRPAPWASGASDTRTPEPTPWA